MNGIIFKSAISAACIVAAGVAASAQTEDTSLFECMYEYSYVRDTTGGTMMDSDGKFLTGNENRISRDGYVLQVGNKASRYYTYDEFYRDSLAAMFGSAEEAGMSSLLAGVEFIVYKDKAEGKVYTVEGVDDSAFYLKEDTPDFGWDITEEGREIFGYQCFKATCSFRGRDYEAWFTYDVPASDGPWKFSGLPGLIVEVYDTPCFYHYRMTGLRTVGRELKGLPDLNYTKLSFKEFYRLKRLWEEDTPTFHAMTSSRPIYYRDTDGNPVDPSLFVHPMRFDFQEKDR